ncbi:MAG: hypothetical protein K940chlam3_00788 [Chlamydiae bacterium]|nr:hypothetical protein [Chlamydiota bacterium]
MTPFTLHKDQIFAVPITHYNMEMAAAIKLAFEEIQPDCVAVELPETMQLQHLHAASRLPDISLVIPFSTHLDPIYYLCEPCDPSYEALRSALETQIPAFCIDLDIDRYPEFKELMPDPYSITKIGLENYYEAYNKIILSSQKARSKYDEHRELYMAKRLKELSLNYDRILFVGGMFHVNNVLELIDRPKFPELKHTHRDSVQICTLTEESCREVMAEFGWISRQYEEFRKTKVLPDRQKLILDLYKEASLKYIEVSGHAFPGYHFRNIMKFLRNYALIKGKLMPDLFQILAAAKGCVDHNYAYEVWKLATEYPHLKNVDGLEEIDLSAKDIWGESKTIHFHMREKGRKDFFQMHRTKKKSNMIMKPPGPFSICSYPPEDITIENFGDYLKKKGSQIICEEGSRSIPFSSSLEDGIDTRETIRHWTEKKLYVKVNGKPPGGVGSVVVIFDEDMPTEEGDYFEKYPWKTTWLGEHDQESDMAFYATSSSDKVVGPGISRCEYGGMMMSYPPRRIFDVWSDPDYVYFGSKSEVLLAAAIDYAVQPLITYVASKPPRSAMKSFARRFGKKIVYVPIGQLSPVTLNKIRVFHVLEGHDRRSIADEFIF